MSKNLDLWKERLEKNKSATAKDFQRINEREAQYKGTSDIRAMVQGDKLNKTPHVRNISAELIESQVNSNIPMPKVTAKRQEDEELAKLIEDMIRNELDRMPFEEINDMLERTVPIQGGAGLLLEWDNTQRTHSTVGELNVTALHPKEIVPQAGVYSGVEDMDYIILEVPQTKGYILRRYGKAVDDESAADSTAEDIVTQCIAYYRNDNGGIGLYTWAGDTELEDIEDYQARKLKRCKTCGAVENLIAEPESLDRPSTDGTYPEDAKTRKRARNACPYCGGGKWEMSTEEYEEIYINYQLKSGEVLPAGSKIPFYKPDIFPVLIQKNVSVHGQFLGDSDLDKIKDQQNTINRLSAKVIHKLMKAGSYMTRPSNASIPENGEDLKSIPIENISELESFKVLTMQGDISQDLAYINQVYEEARQVIGITDSFQGRKDSTATSGKAKEFAAAQSAGRLESKRIMKNAMYASLFEAIFKFKLAYADEPRPVIADDIHGNKSYKEFNRYDFLKRDEAGEWYWNDQFLFSCDTSAPLANNREAMWQEMRMNLQTGAFGNPQDLKVLILFWSQMERLHYPTAGDVKSYLEEELAAQEEMQAMQMQQAQGLPPELLAQIEERARQDAQAAVFGQMSQ